MKAFGIELGGGAPKQPLVVGGVPGVDLLPPEVRIAKRSRRTRRGVVAAAVAVVVLAGSGAVAAKAQSLVAELQLAEGEARTIELLQAQAAFGEVTDVQTEIDERSAARAVATSQEIAWASVVTEIRGMVPAGSTLATIVADGATPMTAYGQSVVPLQGPRLATVTFTIVGPSAEDAAAVLDRLAEMDGYVDAHVQSRSALEGIVESELVLHLDGGALSNRFPAPEAPTAAGAGDGAGTDAEAASGEEGQQ
ncbi:hypothetical protein OVA14_00770 [Agrococcus sp. SL85]|uniref:hypothetical protein n=1 Tax=Agrococcus sp. SL85 TaxID=2995141 RepID=UPI00226CF05F|nr:hypothetical protein [Agrococcus sp. SL85]WAC66366.1 hypothetical protein OVA14_00770 [Agrococcus sp. SL85]